MVLISELAGSLQSGHPLATTLFTTLSVIIFHHQLPPPSSLMPFSHTIVAQIKNLHNKSWFEHPIIEEPDLVSSVELQFSLLFRQRWANIFFRTEYEYEYIRSGNFHPNTNMNIFVLCKTYSNIFEYSKIFEYLNIFEYFNENLTFHFLIL